MGDEKSLAHTRWNCKYHIVFAPKYRRQAFYGEKRRAVGSILRKLCEWKNVRILEALALYTRHAAWLAFAEQHRGQLSVGKQADLAVLNQPFMTMPEDRIDTIRAVLTLVDGRIVHESPDLNAGQ
ncbi:amidohydrolase family [Salmonella enterica subsp. enterica serovar Typhi]|nr:amidohydrolase family [Salmonella enterica subsp. enterica serovar Typhi]